MEASHAAMLNGKMDDMLRELGEHFEAIQIMGSFVDEDGHTVRVTRGVGNWYARQGVAREFLDMDAAQTTAYELSKVLVRDEEGE
jgi:hypothetical protein